MAHAVNPSKLLDGRRKMEERQRGGSRIADGGVVSRDHVKRVVDGRQGLPLHRLRPETQRQHVEGVTNA